MAVKLINFLNYVPFSTASDTYEPLIIITYVLDDGTEIKISANNTEVFKTIKSFRYAFTDYMEGII